MNLSARLTAAMVALVVLAVATVGILTYRKVETAVLPRGLELLGQEAELLAVKIDAATNPARIDVSTYPNT